MTGKVFIVFNALVIMGYSIQFIITNQNIQSRDWMIIIINICSLFINMLNVIKDEIKKPKND
jgi:hypothetical protein